MACADVSPVLTMPLCTGKSEKVVGIFNDWTGLVAVLLPLLENSAVFVHVYFRHSSLCEKKFINLFVGNFSQ